MTIVSMRFHIPYDILRIQPASLLSDIRYYSVRICWVLQHRFPVPIYEPMCSCEKIIFRPYLVSNISVILKWTFDYFSLMHGCALKPFPVFSVLRLDSNEVSDKYMYSPQDTPCNHHVIYLLYIFFYIFIGLSTSRRETTLNTNYTIFYYHSFLIILLISQLDIHPYNIP